MTRSNLSVMDRGRRRGLAPGKPRACLTSFAVVLITATLMNAFPGDPAVGLEPARNHAIPIPTTSPSWLTESVARRLLRDGYAPLPAGAANEGAGLVAPGIHPGQWLQVITAGAGGVNSSTCTGGFIFKKRDRFALGTAGHCAELGSTVSAYVRPPESTGRPPGLYVIGVVTLSTGDNAPAGSDFALVRIDKELSSWVDPQMPFWGGPSGPHTGNAPTPVVYVGHGLATGAGGAPRIGYADRFDQDVFTFVGLSGPGDSGGAILSADGKAVGNQTHTYAPQSPAAPGFLFGTRVAEMLRQARGWSLATTP